MQSVQGRDYFKVIAIVGIIVIPVIFSLSV